MINYDARLFRRRWLKHFEADLPGELRDLKNRGKLRQIVNIILIYAESGISHQKLAEKVKLDRKTLRKYTKWLIEKGLIRREDKNGKYFATNISKNWIYMSADILCKQFLELTFDSIKKEERFFSLPVEQRLSSLKDLELDPLKEVQSEYIKPRATTEEPGEIELERILFDFSNTIGGFITYVLIQSLNPSNEITKHMEDLEEKDLLIQKWVADTLSILSEDLLSLFVKYTELHYSRSTNWTGYSTIDDLVPAFSNSYPELYQELESIRQKLPQGVRKEIEEFKRLRADKKNDHKK